MTVLIKAKWYINNNERWANKTLLSYSQLAALTSADAVDEELNADPIRYYNALDWNSHIWTIDWNDYIVDDLGEKTIRTQSWGYLSDWNYAFYFGDGVWEAEEQAPSLMTWQEIVDAFTNSWNDRSALLDELNSHVDEYREEIWSHFSWDDIMWYWSSELVNWDYYLRYSVVSWHGSFRVMHDD